MKISDLSTEEQASVFHIVGILDLAGVTVSTELSEFFSFVYSRSRARRTSAHKAIELLGGQVGGK